MQLGHQRGKSVSERAKKHRTDTKTAFWCPCGEKLQNEALFFQGRGADLEVVGGVVGVDEPVVNNLAGDGLAVVVNVF